MGLILKRFGQKISNLLAVGPMLLVRLGRNKGIQGLFLIPGTPSNRRSKPAESSGILGTSRGYCGALMALRSGGGSPGVGLEDSQLHLHITTELRDRPLEWGCLTGPDIEDAGRPP